MSSDRISLLNDIVDNFEQIQAYVGELDRIGFQQDQRTSDAVERCLQRISEAAIRLGPDAELLMPQQPRSDIRGMGNWLRHAYHRVDPGVIWETIVSYLPALLRDARFAIKRAE